jgi:hypothetical protein
MYSSSFIPGALLIGGVLLCRWLVISAWPAVYKIIFPGRHHRRQLQLLKKDLARVDEILEHRQQFFNHNFHVRIERLKRMG